MAESQHYLVRLLSTRPDWPENMTPEEEKVMTEHYFYLADLVMRKKVLMAGPCFDPVFGLIVVQPESESELREIMDNDPSVIKGLLTYDHNPMRVSLIADYINPGRYVEDPSDKLLKLERTIPASIADVWKAWTTENGIKSFFAPECRMELRVGGPFEIYFNPAAEYGLKGADTCRVLSWLPEKLLAFDWNAPPSFGDLRKKHTRVFLEFQEMSPGQTKITLSQVGWGKGEEWDKLFKYFSDAWSYVLENLDKRFSEGPRNRADPGK